MSKFINDGGSAFPYEEKNYIGEWQYQTTNHYGMTLRDYFAAQALIALTDIYIGTSGEYEQGCKESYRIADAMIAERDKK